ncbi:MAG: LamG-like jellyroll fold domain-containing protein [Candidatus Paceibacterota bacterium]|jgi:prepilin-type N-terminal cleavage/methylation domain-containing protein
MNKLFKTAFTLIELLVVIAIIGILSGMIVVSMSGVTQKANLAKAQIFANSLRNALMANIVSEWKLDEGSNQSAIDSWGGVNNGRLGATNSSESSDPTWKTTECLFNGCLSFDGNDDFVNIPDSTSLNYGTGDFTVSGWIYVVAGNVIGERGIINKNSTYQGTPGWGIEVAGDSSTYRLIGYNTNGTWNANVLGDGNSTALTYSAWHNFALMRISSVFKLYIDGQQKATNSTAIMGSNVDNSLPLVLGDHSWGSNFNGLLDDIRVYNVAIPISQIKEQYYVGLNKILNSGNISREEYLGKINSIANE